MFLTIGVVVDFTDFAVRIKYESLLADVEPIKRETVMVQVQSLYNQVELIVKSSDNNGV